LASATCIPRHDLSWRSTRVNIKASATTRIIHADGAGWSRGKVRAKHAPYMAAARRGTRGEPALPLFSFSLRILHSALLTPCARRFLRPLGAGVLKHERFHGFRTARCAAAGASPVATVRRPVGAKNGSTKSARLWPLREIAGVVFVPFFTLHLPAGRQVLHSALLTPVPRSRFRPSAAACRFGSFLAPRPPSPGC